MCVKNSFSDRTSADDAVLVTTAEPFDREWQGVLEQAIAHSVQHAVKRYSGHDAMRQTVGIALKLQAFTIGKTHHPPLVICG